jgi:hypothetical protein
MINIIMILINEMHNEDQDKNRNSVNVNAGGDVIGVNVKGDKNVIGKNMNVSQTSNEIKQININQQILSKLDADYAKAFTQVAEALNNQLKASKDVTPQQVTEIQKSLEDVANESEGLEPNQQASEEKKKTWKEKFKIFAKYALKALPKTAATLALFHPLTAPFSTTIDEGLQYVVEGMQEAMK